MTDAPSPEHAETENSETEAATSEKGGARKGKPESDVQRRMREVLEDKQAKDLQAHREDHLGGRQVGPSTNDKHQRQFRRKSG